MKKNIAESIENELPEIIKRIAIDYNIPLFINNPDFLEKRLEKWHQFGLLGHTKKVREIFLNELNDNLKSFGIYEKVQKVLIKKIDNIEKNKLFEASIPLHDLGKIIIYGDTRINREHEIVSRNLIYKDFLNNKLDSMGLSNKHIDYIARCVETHDVIGKEIRDKLKQNNKLNLEYLSDSYVKHICKDISNKYSDIKVELGIFSFCDSLGRTDIRIYANTDSEVIQKESEIIQILEQRSLPSELKCAVIQLPLNIKLAETYLKNLFG